MTVGMMCRSRVAVLGMYIDGVSNNITVTLADHDIIMLVAMVLQMIMHREEHHQHECVYQQGADETTISVMTLEYEWHD
ncbi:MAG: hypothetical protein K0A95_01345 [Chromatiales bacterium]|nr:hypothetical protein [Chromatiales bacterium]